MSNYSINKKILVTRKSDGKQREYDSIVEASNDLGISRAVISRSVNNAFHYSHRYGYKKNKDGTISIHSKHIEYDFELIEGEPVAELWCETDPDVPPFKAKSHSKAVSMLGCSKATYYKRMHEAIIGEPHPIPIMDKEGRNWLIVFNKKETGFKSNIKRLQD